jgi:hypothetical protein
MNYLCLVYHDPAKLDTRPEDEREAFVRESLDYREALSSNGHHVVSSCLQPAEAAVTIRVRRDKLAITGGPLAEAATRERLSAFFLIDARDLNEAIRLASRMPAARFGCIEVRPLQECGCVWSRPG